MLNHCRFGLIMKLEVRYFLPTLSLGARFYSCELSESLEMRKIVAYGTKKQKNPQNRDFSELLRIFTEFCGSKVQLALPQGNFINDVADSKIVYSYQLQGDCK